jgi:hypothetical protein
MVFGISPTDPRIFAGAATGVLAVALLAFWLPARRLSERDAVALARHD